MESKDSGTGTVSGLAATAGASVTDQLLALMAGTTEGDWKAAGTTCGIGSHDEPALSWTHRTSVIKSMLLL